MRFIWATPILFLLNGCIGLAVPPAITAFSYAADGVSLVVSGKSVTDHAISEIAGYDCAMWRVVELKYPCREYVDEDPGLDAEEMVATGAADTIPDDTDGGATAPVVGVTSVPAGTVSAQHPPGSFLPQPQPQPQPQPKTAGVGPEAQPPPRGAAAVGRDPKVQASLLRVRATSEQRVALGSFTTRRYAVRLAQTHSDLGASVAAVAVDGTMYFRVLTAAYRPSDARAVLLRIHGAGMRGAWIVPGCGAPARCRDGSLQVTDASGAVGG